MKTPGGDFYGIMCGNGVLLHAANVEALGPFQSWGRQINELRGCSCCLSAAGSITSPVPAVLGFGFWNTCLAEFWPWWRTWFLHWDSLCVAWMCLLFLIGRFARTMGMRELSSEVFFPKNKGNRWDCEDVNKWEALGRKMIFIRRKDISAFYSDEAFRWERWLVRRT